MLLNTDIFPSRDTARQAQNSSGGVTQAPTAQHRLPLRKVVPPHAQIPQLVATALIVPPNDFDAHDGTCVKRTAAVLAYRERAL